MPLADCCFAPDASAPPAGAVCHVVHGVEAWASDDPSWIRLNATADTTLFSAEFLEQERRELGEDVFKREYLGIPMGGQASPLSWELYERATQVHVPLVPPSPAFGPPLQERAVPIANVSNQSEDSNDVQSG
jgi:hypothetical protein